MKRALSFGSCVALAVVGHVDAVAAGHQTSADILPAAADRVAFTHHGADWNQGGCASRNRQSPVNLDEIFRPPSESFFYQYPAVGGQTLTMKNDGRTISLELPGEGFGGVSLPTGPTWYPLRRIDFHAMSEHTFRGKHAPLEIQLVHEAPPEAKLQAVTVSIMVSSTNPPAVPKQEFPALLQKRSRRHAIRGAGGGVRGGTTSADGTYQSPAMTDMNYNPTIDVFVKQAPPVFDSEINVDLLAASPMQLGNLLKGGTYFLYQGSQTLPPCAESVTWLIRRETVMATDAQLAALFTRLYTTSAGSGNFRTVMPLNQRFVEVLSSQEKPQYDAAAVAAAAAPAPAPIGEEEGVPGEFKLTPWARDAITIAKATSDYTKQLDLKLRAGVAADATTLAEPPPAATPMPAMGMAALPANMSATDETWAANAIGDRVKHAIQAAVTRDMQEMLPAAANLAKSYLRQNILRNAGFQYVPPAVQTMIPPTAGAGASPPVQQVR